MLCIVYYIILYIILYYLLYYIIYIQTTMTFKPMPKVAKTKIKKPSRTSLIKKLDTEFSIYIRTRLSKNGEAECFTCGKKDSWKNLQCGHFMSRKHYSTRWNEINCQVQCVGCNVYRYGEQYKFGVKLNQIYGEGCSQNLDTTTRQIYKIKDFELIEKIEYYKNINNNLHIKN